MKNLKPLSRIAIAISALLMVSAYFVPLWQILMWAPQYPEGLDMKIWINTISGDVKIISALNHYIGMKHIEVSMFPEFTYMIYIVGFIIAFGLLTALAAKRALLWSYAILIIGGGCAALIDFYLWGYDYGHNLNPTAPIVVPGMSYQPPLIGTKQLLNFTAFSGPDIGGWVVLASGIIAIAVLAYEVYFIRKRVMKPAGIAFLLSLLLLACSVKPEPLIFGKDSCYTCKMTLMDKKFGAEIVTKKGKVYKFDDVNCMINFYNSGYEPTENISRRLVVDFGDPEKLIDAQSAIYIESEAIRSPMASHVAAFSTQEEVDKYNAEWNGKPVDWNKLVTQFK